jgi:hypothetical protein
MTLPPDNFRGRRTPQRSARDAAKFRRRRIMVAVLCVVLPIVAVKGISAGWSVVQQRIAASDKVVPSNPITPSHTSTHKVAQVDACADTDIAVAAILDANSDVFDMNTNVVIHATITNISSQKCLRDVGSKANEIRVLDNKGKQVWSSDTCPVKQVINLVELQPGDIARVTLTWGGNVDPRKCGKTAGHVVAGAYSIVARNGNAESEPLPLSFVAATPTPSH